MNPSLEILEVNWAGGEVIQTTNEAAASGLSTSIEALLTLANQTAPLDEGPLTMSGTVLVDAEALEAAMGWDTPYAVRLHENPQYSFQGGRRGKWAELTLHENQRNVMEWLADHLRGALA